MYAFLNSFFTAKALTKAVRMIGGDEIASIYNIYHNREFCEFEEGFGNDVMIEDAMDMDAVIDRILCLLGGTRREVYVDECDDNTLYKVLLLEYYRREYDMGCTEVSELFMKHDVFRMVDDFIYYVYGGECTDNAIVCISEIIEANEKREKKRRRGHKD